MVEKRASTKYAKGAVFEIALGCGNFSLKLGKIVPELRKNFARAFWQDPPDYSEKGAFQKKQKMYQNMNRNEWVPQDN